MHVLEISINSTVVWPDAFIPTNTHVNLLFTIPQQQVGISSHQLQLMQLFRNYQMPKDETLHAIWKI